MNAMIRPIFSTALAAGIVTSLPAFGETPDWVEIDSINYAGTGCPAGTVADNISDDFQAFTLLFDSYFAEVGPDVPLSELRKNCQITIDMRFPQGWSYSILDVDYRGYVALDDGVTGVQKSTYYFQGQQGSSSLETLMTGELDEDYEVNDSLPLQALVWSPCGANRALNINTQVRLNNRSNPDGYGLLTLDSIDGEITHKYGVKWKRCDDGGPSQPVQIFEDDFLSNRLARHWRRLKGQMAVSGGVARSATGWSGAPASYRIAAPGVHRLKDYVIDFDLVGQAGVVNIRARGQSGDGYIISITKWQNGSGAIRLFSRKNGSKRVLQSTGLPQIAGSYSFELNDFNISLVKDGQTVIDVTDGSFQNDGPTYVQMKGDVGLDYISVSKIQ